MVNGSTSRLFCPACERVVERGAGDGGGAPACPGCGGALVGPHADPCPRCGGALTPDGEVCVDCGPVAETIGRPGSRASRFLSSLVALGIGAWLAWKDVASVRSGVFTRGGWRHDILRSDEPVWFWVNVSGVGFFALLCFAMGLGMVFFAIRNRGSAEASFSIRR